MKKILVAQLKQETATFNPTPTVYGDFNVYFGDAVVTAYRGTRTELAGSFEVFDEADVEVVGASSATSVSGGSIPDEDLERLLTELEQAVTAHRDVDGAYIVLHGAMAGVSEGDPEGRVMSAIRAALNCPVVVSIDLHAVLTKQLMDSADVIVPYHTYPHVDHYQTGQRAARVLLRLMEGQARPAVHRIELPMLVRGDELITATGRFGEAIAMCQRLEAQESGLAAGVIIGNPFTDVPDLQSNVLVTTDGDPALAKEVAEEAARFMWDNRENFQAQLTSLGDAIALANATAGLTVFSDAADATASGASGDSNMILRGLLEGGTFAGRALVSIVDAPAARAAHAAGVDATLQVTLGGTRDPQRFQPFAVTAKVKALFTGDFTYEDGSRGFAGATAVLTTERADILVTERSVFVVGQRVYLDHDLDPAGYDVVVVKSPNGFRPYYEAIASRIVPVDVPGSTSANLLSLPFTRCVRPIFPLDQDVQWP